MKRITHGVLGISLLACGYGCASSDSMATSTSSETAETGTVQGAITIADLLSLPICTFLNKGVVYYVKSTKALQYCDGSTFRPIDNAGLAGAPGTNGTNGVSYLVTTAPATTCANGGVAISVGPDSNHDGLIDTATTTTVCNGADGAPGATGAPGTNGTNGNDGAAGPSGASSLIATSAEPAGDHCATGGLRVDVGLDTNHNGTLDSTEVTNTQYVCAPSAAAPVPPAAPAKRVVGYLFVDRGITTVQFKGPGQGDFLNAYPVYAADIGLSTGQRGGKASLSNLTVKLDAIDIGSFATVEKVGSHLKTATVLLALPDAQGAVPALSHDMPYLGVRCAGPASNDLSTGSITIARDAIDDDSQTIEFTCLNLELNGGTGKATFDFPSAVSFSPTTLTATHASSPSYVDAFQQTLGLASTSVDSIPFVIDDNASAATHSTFSMGLVTSGSSQTGGAGGRVTLAPASFERPAGAGAVLDAYTLATGTLLRAGDPSSAANRTVFSLPGEDIGLGNALLTSWSLKADAGGVRESVLIDYTVLAIHDDKQAADGGVPVDAGTPGWSIVPNP